MTFDDFKIKVRKKTSFDRYWYNGLCTCLISFCTFSTFYITFRPENFQGFRVILYVSFLSFISIGIYGIFWLLPKRYRIVTIDSDLPLAKKQAVVESLFSIYKVFTEQCEQRYFSFTMRPDVWNSAYKVNMFYDELRFAFSLQSQDSSSGGFIDFGGADEKRSELSNTIMELVIEELRAANSSLQQ